jgi:UDP-glucose 4-epimerase
MDETETLLNPVNPYDCSKISFNSPARCFATAVTGLRLGTVCGFSPQLRAELIFNAMNRTALGEGRVRVANPGSHRNILFLDDLAHYVLGLLKLSGTLPPILNAGSLNLSVGELGRAVAAFHRVPVEALPGSKTYSFRMNCAHMHALCGPPRAASLAERCAELVAGLLASEPSPELRKAS